MLVVLVTDKKLGGTVPYGPYRSSVKAQEIVDLFRDTGSVDYRDPEEYDIRIAKLERYGS